MSKRLSQNNCINNGVINGLKERHVKQFYMLTKKREERQGEWLIEAYTHRQTIGTLPFNCNTTLDKEKARNAFIDEVKGV